MYSKLTSYFNTLFLRTLENSLVISSMWNKYTLYIWLSYLTPTFLLKMNNKNIGSHKYLYANVYGRLCKIAQIWKQAEYPSIGETVNAFWLQINSRILHSNAKDCWYTYARRIWKVKCWGKESRQEKTTYSMILFYNSLEKAKYKDKKSISGCLRISVEEWLTA